MHTKHWTSSCAHLTVHCRSANSRAPVLNPERVCLARSVGSMRHMAIACETERCVTIDGRGRYVPTARRAQRRLHHVIRSRALVIVETTWGTTHRKARSVGSAMHHRRAPAMAPVASRMERATVHTDGLAAGTTRSTPTVTSPARGTAAMRSTITPANPVENANALHRFAGRCASITCRMTAQMSTAVLPGTQSCRYHSK